MNGQARVENGRSRILKEGLETGIFMYWNVMYLLAYETFPLFVELGGPNKRRGKKRGGGCTFHCK